MITKQKAYAKINELVTRFEEQIDSYKQFDFNETLIRRNFIDPLFNPHNLHELNETGFNAG